MFRSWQNHHHINKKFLAILSKREVMVSLYFRILPNDLNITKDSDFMNLFGKDALEQLQKGKGEKLTQINFK